MRTIALVLIALTTTLNITFSAIAIAAATEPAKCDTVTVSYDETKNTLTIAARGTTEEEANLAILRCFNKIYKVVPELKDAKNTSMHREKEKDEISVTSKGVTVRLTYEYKIIER